MLKFRFKILKLPWSHMIWDAHIRLECRSYLNDYNTLLICDMSPVLIVGDGNDWHRDKVDSHINIPWLTIRYLQSSLLLLAISGQQCVQIMYFDAFHVKRYIRANMATSVQLSNWTRNIGWNLIWEVHRQSITVRHRKDIHFGTDEN